MHTNRGFTLIELIVYMIVLAIGSAGIMMSISAWNSRTSDHLTVKQAYAIAESIMEELNAMPLTYCDPQDTNVLTATGYGDCTNPQNVLGPVPASESRGDPVNPFDHLLDYHGFTMAGISYIDNVAIPELSNYSAAVSISAATVSGIPGYTVKVTVTPPYGTDVILETFRTMYAPGSV